jgi:hypothetical protein
VILSVLSVPTASKDHEDVIASRLASVAPILAVPTTTTERSSDPMLAIVPSSSPGPAQELSPAKPSLFMLERSKSKRLVDYTALARVDFLHLKTQLKEYRNSLIEESDRKEFDGKSDV